MHVSVIVKLASPSVNEPYAHQSRACDSRNCRRDCRFYMGNISEV